jgi:hypothetical protein
MMSALDRMNSVLAADVHSETKDIDVGQQNLFHQAEAKKDLVQRQRVGGNISLVILEFLKERVKAQSCNFSMTELEEYVKQRHHITPGSAGRILRDLRLIGKIQCELLDRQKSLYAVYSVSI